MAVKEEKYAKIYMLNRKMIQELDPVINPHFHNANGAFL